MRRNERNKLFIAGGVFAGALAALIWWNVISIGQAIELTILFVLVCVTAIYAKRTAEIADATKEQAKATKQQADASVKMAEAIDKPIVLPSVAFTHFSEMRASFKNIGRGPALHVEANICHPYFDFEGPLPETVLEVGRGVELCLERTDTELRSHKMFEVITKYQDIYGKWFRCRLTQDEHGQNHLEYKELQKKEDD